MEGGQRVKKQTQMDRKATKYGTSTFLLPFKSDNTLNRRDGFWQYLGIVAPLIQTADNRNYLQRVRKKENKEEAGERIRERKGRG